ncbi:MAG: CvpA family protein [Prevotellaceae bacterium]|nr:CvpA family protein [Prevotellaceae bacterium]
MGIFDIIFALLFGYAIYTGIKQGLVMQLASLLALLLGAYIAFKFSGLLAKWITGFGVGDEAVALVSFSLTFVGVLLLTRLVGRVVEKIVKVSMLGWLNRLLGVVFAMLKVAFIVSIALYVVNSVDRMIPFLPQEQVSKSKLYAPLSGLAPAVFSYLDFEKMKASMMELDKKVDEKMDEIK